MYVCMYVPMYEYLHTIYTMMAMYARLDVHVDTDKYPHAQRIRRVMRSACSNSFGLLRYVMLPRRLHKSREVSSSHSLRSPLLGVQFLKQDGLTRPQVIAGIGGWDTIVIPTPGTTEKDVDACKVSNEVCQELILGIQIAQSSHYLHTLGPKVGIFYILGSPGFRDGSFSLFEASHRDV